MASSNSPKARFYYSEKRSIYIGRMKEVFCRKTGPSMIMVSLDQDVDVLDQDSKSTCRTKSILLSPGSPVVINTHRANMALCFLDDAERDFRKLIPNFQRRFLCPGRGTLFCDLEQESYLAEKLKEIWQNGASADAALDVLGKSLALFDDEGSTQEGIDVRVVKAISIIRDTSSKNISIYEIAQEVDLSLPRLAQLFKETTGTSIRSFRLWCRVFKAAQLSSSGLSLTTAAVQVGFADYAQCYRAYRELGGSDPKKTIQQTEVKVA